MHTWNVFVAIGDSFTEGVGDAVKGQAPESALDQLAARLRCHNPDLRYVNLAKRGLTTQEVRETQLEPALAEHPDLVSIVAGANDLLKGPWQPKRYEQEMQLMLHAFEGVGAALMTATHPDWTVRLQIPETAKVLLQQRILEANEIVRNLAATFDVALVETYRLRLDYDPSLWSRDRIHPNALGYDAYAKIGLEALSTHTKLIL